MNRCWIPLLAFVAVSLVVPANQARSDDHGGFNWGGFLGGMIGRALSSPSYYPSRSYPRSYPQYQTVPGRTFQQQNTLPPRQQTVRAAPKPNVKPKPNQIFVKVPTQSSPLEGVVSEVSTREAFCYAKELAASVDRALADVLARLQADGVDTKDFEARIAKLQELMGGNASWREIEPAILAMLQGNQAVNGRPEILEQFKRIVQLIAIRDSFRIVMQSTPRARRSAIPVSAVPTGQIWVLYDPALPVGTALMVNSTTMVVGAAGRPGAQGAFTLQVQAGGCAGELTVARSTAAEALGLPVSRGIPVPNVSKEDAEPDKDVVMLRNSQDAGADVNYVLNDRYPYEIKPGYKQLLPADRTWVVSFDRGNSQGTARYSLKDEDAVYEFRIVDKKWTLVKLSFDVTIDNRDNKEDFQYVTQNQIVTVKAGETKTHKSDEPIVLTFDTGEGADNPARKKLNKSGTYKIAVNTDTNYYDLFAEADPSQSEPDDDRLVGAGE